MKRDELSIRLTDFYSTRGEGSPGGRSWAGNNRAVTVWPRRSGMAQGLQGNGGGAGAGGETFVAKATRIAAVVATYWLVTGWDCMQDCVRKSMFKFHYLIIYL